ncbi:MAG: glucan 1,4-alpha-glucosidase, partial [Desulfuromonadales bacterium]
LISEQVWDSEDLPERSLFCGKPSGSAMPLVWAHAEYLKLRRSLQEGRVFDMPPHTVARYIENRTPSPCFCWRFSHKCRTMPAGKKLRLELTAEAIVRWSANDWTTIDDAPTRDSGFGLHFADLPTDNLLPGSRISFTFQWTRSDHWEGANFVVALT